MPGTGESRTFPAETSSLSERPSVPSPEEMVIGSYRLLYCVGEGGMGEVWLAEQTAPVYRRVALKLIKAGMDTKAVVARFESERQALAMMNHPGIAKVFEAGETDRGRPYFVMEYVAGVPLTEYCDAHKLSATERIDLFIQVCAAIQHAHHKAVIHRDLKPSNILVQEMDGQPEAKVIDFGIAKAISHRLTEKTLFTEAGALLGTPEYMSPEQINLTQEEVDTRTDVYSMGVILYELLSGARPFDSDRLRASSYEELRRLVKEVEPPLPSMRFSTLDATTRQHVAQLRRTDPHSLRRLLSGDLDAMAMRALEKDVRRRYATPSALADDLLRHLRHEPVVARVPSRIYRATKYMRRHAVGVGVAAVLFIVALAFGALSFLQARRVAKERDRATVEAATARSVSEFLLQIFKAAHPFEAQGKSVTARELLDRAVREIDGLNDQPRLQIRLLSTLGEVYATLDKTPTALALHDRAAKLAVQHLDASSVEAMQVRVRLAKALIYGGQYERAERALHSVLPEIDRPPGTNDPDLARARNYLILLGLETGRYVEAERLALHYRDIQTRTFGEEHSLTLNLLQNLAEAYLSLKKFAEAESTYRETIERETRALGPDHPITIVTVQGLGKALLNSGRLDESEVVFKDALDRNMRVFGADHLNALAVTSNLADVYTAQGRLDLAESTINDLLRRKRQVLGPDHRSTIITEHQVGRLLLARKRFDAARQSFLETLEHARRAKPRGHFTRYDALLALASVEFAIQDWDTGYQRVVEAIEESEDVREILAKDPEWAEYRPQPRFQELLRKTAKLVRSSEQ